ncbi:gliding motility lipoprotein GldH [Aquaticitalea lipolytica]|jgi:gliding motility-associated lipoprotein GldH|uniref:Gliding motility lipoprotein GldH n=1 Tax=Aquaticitalea lipolytica TaxID=1247562 RepID=A0A8J2TN94_9FLAO|nr:gliding motility lipoprotein GldH [Aquaticitalea lipolytica]GFZ83339.1 gliding motility lipoprotein GldH [Aquaticitalea lipolytica]
MPSKGYWIVLIAGIVLSSCDSNQVFDEYKTVPNQWNKDSIISFNITPPDSTKAYNLFVNIRNTSAYKYRNLFLIVDMNFPNGKVIKDTLEYEMAKPNGELLGTGFADVKENKLWYKESVIFKETGEYKVNIQHAMRKNGDVEGIDELEGVTDIGFRIEPAKN